MNKTLVYSHGKICLEINIADDAVNSIEFMEKGEVSVPQTKLEIEVFNQLDEYFEGKRKSFDLRLNPAGTPFQKAVWKALTEIPYGETKTYSEIAKVIGNPTACRAVGNANNRNPLPIVVPCHRVVGKDGKLRGFRGGLPLKDYLLKLEKDQL